MPAAATHYFQQGSQVINEGKSENPGLGLDRSFITYIIISVVVSVALLRLMGDVLVSCRFRSDSGAPEKFILYYFFQLDKIPCVPCERENLLKSRET